MNKMTALFAAGLAMALLAGCATTSVMGSGFEKTGADTYVIKVATGGLPLDQAIAAEGAAKSRLEAEIKKFLPNNTNYATYKIINTERSIFPLSYYKYTVEFK